MKYTKHSLSADIANALVREHGSISDAARATLNEWEEEDGKKPSFDAVRHRIAAAIRDNKRAKTLLDGDHAHKVNRIVELLEDANVDPEAIGKIEKVRFKSWGVHAKVKEPVLDEEGNPVLDERGKPVMEQKIVTKSLFSTNLLVSPSWEEGPKWPVIQPAKPIHIKTAKYKPRQYSGKVVVILPDAQVGFMRNIDNVSQLTPMHDRLAIDVALQVVADLQPDQLGWIGDFLDLPEMSRWLQLEEYWRTTQPAIDEGHQILAEFEAAAGENPDRERTFFIAGNHDRRLREYASKSARAAYGLRKATETPADWPALTVPWALELDKLNIEYCGEYPGSEKWLTPRLVVRHNPEKRGAYDASVIAGHTHKMKRETFSHRSISGPVHHTLYEIGCLCRIDNYSDRNSLMATSVPSARGFIKDWVQGLAVVYIDEDGEFQVDQVEIRQNNGKYKAIYGGRVYAASLKEEVVA